MKNNKTILGRLRLIGCKLQGIIDSCAAPLSNLTSFNASSNMGNCDVTAPSYPDVYYHDGEGEYPQIGDSIYSDPLGENLVTDTIIVSDEPNNVPINLEGMVTAFNCE